MIEIKKFNTAEHLSHQPIIAMIYGQPGIGKTTFACSSPNPILLDFDRGAHRVAAQVINDAVRFDNFEDVLKFLTSEEIKNYDTLIIDTVSDILNLMTAYIIKFYKDTKKDIKIVNSTNILNIQGWTILKNNFLKFFDMLRQINKNLIFISQEQEIFNEEKNLKEIRPDVSKSIISFLVSKTDILGYMSMRDSSRCISFSPTENYIAKNCYNLPKIIDITNNYSSFDSVVLENIRKYHAYNNSQKEAYFKLISENENKISQIQDIVDLNVIYSDLKAQKPVGDSQTKWKKNLQNKAKELGAKFDIERSVFYDIKK